MSKIKDIKVVGPEDKLLILITNAPPQRLEQLAGTVEDFMNKEKNRVLVIKDMQPYIIRKGAKISLAMMFEEVLGKEGE